MDGYLYFSFCGFIHCFTVYIFPLASISRNVQWLFVVVKILRYESTEFESEILTKFDN